MYKNVLRAIDNIEIFPVISLVIFMVFFLLLIAYVIKMNKGMVHHMESLPLEIDQPEKTNHHDIS